jgi:hypothetical protein
LKGHRDSLYKLVAEGKLPAGDENVDGTSTLVAEVLQKLGAVSRSPVGPELKTTARRILLTAVQGDGHVAIMDTQGGLIVDAGNENLAAHVNQRIAADYRHAVRQLESLGLIEDAGSRGEVFYATHTGYQLADELLAQGGKIEAD